MISCLKKLNKSTYEKYKKFVNLFNENIEDNQNVCRKKLIPIKVPLFEKKDEVDRSILYSFDGPFQLLHADVGNLAFLCKSATDPRYCLLIVDLFTSKVYVYPMKLRKLRKLIASKMESFYKEVEDKRKDLKTRLQTNLEFKQKKNI